MMIIAILPALFVRRQPARPPGQGADTAAGASRLGEVAGPTPSDSAARMAARPAATGADTVARPPEQIIRVVSPLYTYGFSTQGGRLVEARLHRYRSMAPGARRQPLELFLSPSDVLGLRLAVGADTVALREWDFVPSRDSVSVTGADSLVLTGSRGSVRATIRFRFEPDSYLVGVAGRLEGIGPNGGMLVVGLGPGLRNVEADSSEHQRSLGIVTKAAGESRVTGFGKLKQGVPIELSGPFEWVAVKSKYFVAALFAVDTLSAGTSGRLSGVRAVTTDQRQRPAAAEVLATLPVPAAGTFGYTLYAGPMEYPRLRAVGHDFYDVNPYGWPGFRTVIRPVAVAARWLLVLMHEALGIAYGLGLVLFGVVIRLALWPLNQKAMRSSMQMQVVQPLLKDLQARYKNDPPKLQQEMLKLYKEHKVNPLGGCLPMLLPMPVLFALFFVFQNTIELRGAPFLWLADLSRPDPLYIIPVLMGVSMFAVSWIGQMGVPPNPQMKMMLYMMPAVMTVLFLKFASGLNLYYAVQNVASLPQQWLLAKERRQVTPPAPKPPAPRGRRRT